MFAEKRLFKRLFIVLVLLFSSASLKAQLTWTAVQTPVVNALEKVTFVNGEVGWTYTSNGKILKSEDEGMSWQIVYSDTSKSFWGMHWLNENTGYFSGIEVCKQIKRRNFNYSLWVEVVMSKPINFSEPPSSLNILTKSAYC